MSPHDRIEVRPGFWTTPGRPYFMAYWVRGSEIYGRVFESTADRATRAAWAIFGSMPTFTYFARNACLNK